MTNPTPAPNDGAANDEDLGIASLREWVKYKLSGPCSKDAKVLAHDILSALARLDAAESENAALRARIDALEKVCRDASNRMVMLFDTIRGKPDRKLVSTWIHELDDALAGKESQHSPKTPYTIRDHDTDLVYDWTWLLNSVECMAEGGSIPCAKCEPGARDSQTISDSDGFYVACIDCEAETPHYPSELQALTAWAAKQMQIIINSEAWWQDKPPVFASNQESRIGAQTGTDA